MSSLFATNQDTVEQDKNHVWHHLTQHKAFEEKDPLIIVEGKGMRVKDINGKEYLDATSGGVWTVNVGYGNKRIADAIHQQLLKLPYYAGSAGTEPGAKFAQMLSSVLPGLDRVYYSNSGSEANEKGYKLVRQLAHLKYDGKKNKIIFRNRDYHGTTIGALSSCGQNERKDMYGPFADGFVEMPHCSCYRCPFKKTYGNCNIECATVLEDIIQKENPETVGSVVLEPITAGGGVIPPVKEYFPIISDICKKYDVLLHIDEVVCGLGRTGKWFGHQHYDVKPDIVAMAKGVASGYAAISVTAISEAVFNDFKSKPEDPMAYFRDISTFGGCTAGPAAAVENMRIIEENNLIENVRVVGDYLLDKLRDLQQKYSVIGDVRGKGLFAGIELVTDRESKTPLEESKVVQVVADCAAQGVLLGRINRSVSGLNNCILFSPSYICSKGDIDEIIHTLDISMSKYLA